MCARTHKYSNLFFCFRLKELSLVYDTDNDSMKRFLTGLLSFVIVIPSFCAQGMISHDIGSLQKWGPYSKEYFGVSHIDDLHSGIQVEFCLVPGVYRRNVKVPCALFESDVHPWYVSEDMRHITYRQEIEWKDRVYAELEFAAYGPEAEQTLRLSLPRELP